MPKTKKPTPKPPVELTGYIRSRAPRYAWREFTPRDLPEGAEPLRVKVRVNLSIEEQNAIPVSDGTTFREQWDVIAPYVAEWNVLRENHATGELEQVPAPAEAGPDAFLVLDQLESLWLVQQIKYGYAIRTDAEKKASTPSDTTPASSSAPGSPTAS